MFHVRVNLCLSEVTWYLFAVALCLFQSSFPGHVVSLCGLLLPLWTFPSFWRNLVSLLLICVSFSWCLFFWIFFLGVGIPFDVSRWLWFRCCLKAGVSQCTFADADPHSSLWICRLCRVLQWVCYLSLHTEVLAKDPLFWCSSFIFILLLYMGWPYFTRGRRWIQLAICLRKIQQGPEVTFTYVVAHMGFMSNERLGFWVKQAIRRKEKQNRRLY